MNKLNLKMKLGLGFGVLLVLMMVLGICGYRSAVTADKLSEEVDKVANKKELALMVEASLEMQSNGARGFLLTGREDMLGRDEEGKAKFKESFDELERLATLPEVKKLLAAIQEDYGQYRPVLDQEIELRRQGKTADAVALVSAPEAGKLRAEIRKDAAEVIEIEDKVKKEATDKRASNEATAKTLVLSLLLVGAVLGFSVSLFITRSITGAISKMVNMIQEIAGNNLTVPDLEIKYQDEIGHAGVALNRMKNNLHEVIQSIAGSALQVGSASEELNTTSQQITANSEETSAQADLVSKAAQSVSQNLQTVATGAEEMGASIKEIAKNATEAAKVATSAVKIAETTTAIVSKLGDSSTEIGNVIKVITSIAQQTNLLALNATIEAARAGEAGKGFAVVANEVKELAKETARATEDISRKIEAIQSDTQAAVDAIASISGVINQVNDISGTIATAVEEQNATTNEMSRNVSEAAQGSGEITGNIAGVAEAAQSTTRGAADTQKASQQLVETSTQLRRLLEQFKIDTGNHRAASDAVRSKAARAGA
jgi:methyl-accepting chemotaxis protein